MQIFESQRAADKKSRVKLFLYIDINVKRARRAAFLSP